MVVIHVIIPLVVFGYILLWLVYFTLELNVQKLLSD
jgi:hypothetical protein